MTKSDPSTVLASQYGLRGLLGISHHGKQVCVELDLPEHDDRIDNKQLPAVEALVVGFLRRLMRKTGHRDRTVAAQDDYVTAWVHADDLDHFLIGLAALLDGRQKPNIDT